MTKIEFTQQVAQHTDSLRNYAKQFTKDIDDTNDLLQDTILKAITYADKFKDGTNLKGWLYTIMKNTFINNYRRVVKTNYLIDKSDELSSPQLYASASSNFGENGFIRRDIEKAMSKLSSDYVIPFTLYFEGYRYHEISEYLNIPIGTVKTRIHIARKQLKSSLKTYNPN